ncbi:MAG: peptidase C39 family protein, partial [Woeseiaceae bacterium]
VPHYRQSLSVTCGPASLLMAMTTLDRRTIVNRAEELDLYREMTTISYPTDNGHGGCLPQSLALAAVRRGFNAELHMDWRKGEPYPVNVRTPKSRDRVEVWRLMWDRDMSRSIKEGVRHSREWPGLKGIEARFDEGWLPIVHVNCKYLHDENEGHFVVITGFDDQSFYINDPWVAVTKGKTAADMTNRGVPRREFDRIARFAIRRWRAVVILR